MVLFHEQQQKVLRRLHHLRTHLLPDCLNVGRQGAGEAGLEVSLFVKRQHLLRRLIDALCFFVPNIHCLEGVLILE